MHPVTHFKNLEVDKENIKPIPQGRSAAKLNELIHTDQNTLEKKLNEEQLQFEESLTPEILQELDDPLESYLTYLKWIRENYRTGNNDSLYIQVLERTTHDFKDDNYYKNEVRYFNVWLDYISFSDHPGDVFSYLFKKNIGSELSLFFENYSLYFELNDQWDMAESIYKDGITKRARPFKRLLKSYNEFQSRKAKKAAHLNDSVSISESKGLLNPDGLGLSSSSSVIPDSTEKSNILPKKPNKMQIFNDNANENNDSTHENESIKKQNISLFANLDTIKNSKKENVINPSSWEGQKLKSATAKPPTDKKSKIEIFNDKKNEYPVTTPVVLSNGTVKEVYDFNLELFIPSNSTGVARSWLDVLLMFNKPIENNQFTDNTVTTTNTNKRLPSSLFNTPVTKKAKTDSIEDSNENNQNDAPSPCDKSPGIDETPILDYFKNSKDGLFSGMNDFVGSKEKTPDKRNLQNQLENEQVFKNDAESIGDNEKNLLDAIIGDKFNDIFTDTITRTKSLNLKLDMNNENNTKQNENTENATDALLSSPFVDNPILKEEVKDELNIINPFDHVNKMKIISTIEHGLFKDLRFHYFANIENSKLSVLKSIFKPNSNPIYGNRQAMIEFEKDNIYCVTKELGQGEFSTVYLSEKMNGQLNAIKIESPSNIWEAYILSKINKVSNDFIKLQGFYRYSEESFLILPYFRQGTILDLVNCSSDEQFLTGKNFIDETIIIYLTIQLITNIIKLHSLNIIHCNVKPENCMLNIQSSCNNNKVSFKDIILIDFNKSIDISLYNFQTQFQCKKEKTNPEDCYEIVNNLPWKYEPDYHGIANVIHLLLFNSPLKTKKLENGKIELVEPIKRYWQTESWNELFSILLNPKKYSTTGLVSNELKQIKGKFESWFSLTVDKRLFLSKLRYISEVLDTRIRKKSK